MPKAEVGSVKHLNKQIKARGLTRLRWYCQVCERGMRDENAFKQHTLSESHVRNMLAVGSDPRKVINEYSDQFLKDFLQLLRTGHGEKQVQINHFYQEYIARREHVHMNATRWSTLTELAKYLGREGICRVEENEKGIFIAWIDTSPDALRRQEALRRKEAQDRGDEEWERRMLKAQIERAERAAQARRVGGKAAADGAGEAGDDDDDDDDEARESKYLLQRAEGEKIKLSFGVGSSKQQQPAAVTPTEPTTNWGPAEESKPMAAKETATAAAAAAAAAADQSPRDSQTALPDTTAAAAASMAVSATAPASSKPLALKLGGLSKPQPKNVFAAAKKNALAGGGGGAKKIEVPKKMSEAERIMKEEMERKRGRAPGSGSGSIGFRFGGPPPAKKPRT